ncbi:adenylate/guanylate cyclase domain-containing protein [Thalassobaculum sp. OXR-137]|uniref:adenylate/guanylate cyclase domain-containing protein n=1 Tax=Thalassobaculum sp. OXR-137 TaxID=3100173 RepID=UPI002AC93459|nr:adenylate/guanylate cyclase domain-containing protein [Thalassobaculum sp. OXR-137]WPZ36436.1 adenylate/guanylate cyclase domain-containing protein [Thalassobaculum sp. OXR-137]
MSTTAEVLRDREAKGVALFITLEIVGLAALTAGILLFVSRAMPLSVLAVSLPGILVLAGLLFRVRRRRWVTRAGLVAVLVSILATGPFVFLEWEGTGTAAAYLAKTGYPMGLILLVLTATTLQPIYPAIVTVLLALFHGLLIGLALDDPSTVLATLATWQEHVMGPALHLGRTANEMAFLLATGAIVTFSTWIARRTVMSAARLEQAAGQLSRYFSPEVAERVATADPDFLRPGGSLRFVAVLVSDIGGFTALSASIGPDATMRFLADYQKRMTEVIFRNGGSVDKFIGDGILATFGATGTMPSPCERAVATAQGMMAALHDLNADRAAAGEPPVTHRIGVHAGEAMVGNVGSEDRLEFTVIGDVVNLTNRIEQACKQTGDAVLLSRAVLEACPDVTGTSRGCVPLPGVETPPELFALTPPADRETA